MNRMASTLISFLLLIVSSVLSLIVTIGILNVVYSFEQKSLNWHDRNTRFDRELGWVPVESSTASDNQGRPISNNRDGFRSPEVDSSKAQIVLVGDSLAWGFGVADNETIGRQLEKYFDTNVSQVTTVAVSGYGIDQYYLYLKRNLHLFPRIKALIVVICTINDIEGTQSNTFYEKQKPLFHLIDEKLVLTGVPIDKYSRRNLLSYLPIVGKLSRSSPLVSHWVGDIAGDVTLTDEETWKVIIKLLEQMKKEFLPKGVPLTIVLAPHLGDFKGDRTRYEEYKQHLDLQHFDYLDLRSSLKQTSIDPRTFYIDGVHYSQRGNQIVSELLYSYLSRK